MEFPVNDLGQLETMSAEGLKNVALAKRIAFWIWLGTALFLVGLPMMINRTLTHSIAAVFLVLAVFTRAGFSWARFTSAVLSGLMALLLFSGPLETVLMGKRSSIPPILVAVGFLPSIGYGVCAALLFHSSVGIWQDEIRRATAERILASGERALAIAAADVAMEPCFWCDAIAVDPRDGYCRSCRRPSD
jgi:hypothetical protein